MFMEWALVGAFEAVDGVNAPGSPLEGVVSYLQVVAIVVTLYDHMITFDQEVQYVWAKPRGFIRVNTVLYIAARYLGDIIVLLYPSLFLIPPTTSSAYATVSSSRILILTRQFSLDRCNAALKLMIVGGLLLALVSQGIMQLRIKSLYHSRTVSNTLGALWALEILSVAVVFSLTFGSLKALPLGRSGAELCTVVRVPRLMALFWVPVIAFDAVLFYLSIRVGIYNRRQYGHWAGEKAFVGKLLSVLLQDNCIYFVLGFISYLVTIIVLLTVDPRYFLIPTIIGSAVNTNASCRFVLNLYGAYRGPVGTQSLDGEEVWAMEGIRFARFSADRATRPSTGSQQRSTIIR